MNQKLSISRRFHGFGQSIFSCDLNMMHAWGAVDLRIYLATKNHGYSISAQSYDFCPCLIKLDILYFTLSHMPTHCASEQVRKI